MKMIVLAHFDNSYWGCSQEEIFVFDKNTSTETISDEIWGWACGLAESFAYLHFGFGNKYSEEEYDFYLENLVHMDWEVIDYETYLSWCEKNGINPRDYEEIFKED